MDLKKVLEKIDFVNRYKKICQEHNDFDNSMSENNKNLTSRVLGSFKYNYKYFSNGSFYQIKEQENNITFQLHLVLKRGIVETLLFIMVEEKTIEPQGRIDFFPEDVGITYDRMKYGLPKYCSEVELREILADLFSIYEDLKTEVIKQNS
ncbi:hypothetical protein [Xanthomarina gelatinilytica]|uniref:hypothetical protein n=1 Tax=Xanthomarina gelatinilytica TaxID=1137281 RepID=UPI003AA8201F